MKKFKITSLFLAFFMFSTNIVPTSADEIYSNEKSIIEDSFNTDENNFQKKSDNIQTDFKNQNLKKSKENEKKSETDLDVAENIKTKNPKILYNRYFNPKYDKTKLIVKIKLHGLNGKDFDFKKVYPNGGKIYLKGKSSVHYNDIVDGKEVIKHYVDELNKSSDFSKDKLEIDFGLVSQLFFADEFLNSYQDESYVETSFDLSNEKTFKTDTSKEINWDGKYPTTTINIDLYQVQNTDIIVKTKDENGNLVDNPSFGEIIYRIGNESRTKNIPKDNNRLDLYENLKVDEKNIGNFNGSKEKKINLKDANSNGFISKSGEDFSYKIERIKQEQPSNPTEVNLIRKKKVILGKNRPKYLDLDTGKRIFDNDYVKVEFDCGEKGRIEDSNQIYWVLKGENVKGKIKAPKVSSQKGYELIGWNPSFDSNLEVYYKDTIYKANIKEISYFDYSTYAGDVVNYPVKIQGARKTEQVSLEEENNQLKKLDMKDKLDLENLQEVKINIGNQTFENQDSGNLVTDLKLEVDNGFGDKILKNEDKKIVKKIYMLSSDVDENKSWSAIRYTIKTQNSKGEVIPQEIKTRTDEKLSKKKIIEAVKKGEFTYNEDVPQQNKTGQNALDMKVDGKNVLNPDNIKNLEVKDQDYKKINLSKENKKEVPVTITY
ncbi:MAG: hypothetical protein ACLRVH_01745, partial [Anaerococcus obesiensis]